MLFKTRCVKALYFRFLLLAVFAFLFSACSLFIDDSQVADLDDSSTFIVEQIRGQVVATRVNGLPEEFQISYTACFRDFIHQDNPLQNSLFKIHFFEDPAVRGNLKIPSFVGEKSEESKGSVLNLILEPGKTNKKSVDESEKECSESSSFIFSGSKASCLSIRTDSAGCLNWTEVYPYHPINQSVWFRYERAFEGTGVHKGQTFVPMAVNPWLSTDLSGSTSRIQLVDLRYYSVNQKRKLISLKERDIPQCRFCSSNENKQDCDLCKRKTRSLSSVMTDFEQKTNRPRLWLHKVDSNISQEHIIISRQEVTEDQLQILKRFKVCHSDIKEDCDPPGRFFKVRLQLPLRVHVKDYRNEDNYPLLTRGNYSIQAYLFLKGEEGGHTLLHREMGFVSSALTGGKTAHLKSEFYLHVPYEHYGLPAFLALKVQAEGELKSFFLPFEGVFAFPNRLKTVIGRNTLDLESSSEAFYKKKPNGNGHSLITDYKLTGSWLKEQKEGFRRAGWDVRLNRFRFSGISIDKNQCATAVDRTVRYVGEVCIVDPLTNKVVPNTNITIQRQDIFFSRSGNSKEGEVVRIPGVSKGDLMPEFTEEGRQEDINGRPLKKASYISDTSGCLQWVDHLYHKWYNREKYFVRKMVFSKPEWGFEGERMIAINPWHWGFVFFQDITQLGDSSIRTTAERAEFPQIVLHDFRSLFPDPIYTIDRFLGINLFQNLLFLFRVKVDRPDNVSSGQGGQRPSSQDVRRGYYFLRLILVKSHVEEQGSKGNQVVHDETFRKQYGKQQDWNTQTGWKVVRGGKQIGQMMNTNLEYITHFDTYVQIRDSTANAYTNFLFNLDEFIFIGSNSRVIVQLLPTDPKYYVYHPDSCEVDPSRSVFVPFKGHELISRPFMGTFVPGDQRNWNIFRVLSEYVNLDLPGAKRKEDTVSLDMNPEQVERFIRQGREHSREHELFIKLQANLVVETDKWGRKSRALIRKSAVAFKKLYEDMELFLKTPPPAEADLLSKFSQNKNRLIESLDQAVKDISVILEGAIEDDKHQLIFQKLNLLFDRSLFALNNSSADPKRLHTEMENTKNSFLHLTGESLRLPLSFKEQQTQLQKNQNNTARRWFSSEISFPEDPNKWSGFNMNLFAKTEGLKVITMDDKAGVEGFLTDLNDFVKIHNDYHNTYSQYIENITEKQPEAYVVEGEVLEADTHPDKWNDYQDKIESDKKDAEIFWNNFKLLEGDNYYTATNKVKKMYLPEMSQTWLTRVLENGVHSGNMQTPEVMTFFHALCGFWFDKFYAKYLEPEQLRTIYLKHIEHFRYYKGVLDYLSESHGSEKQYEDLYQAMQKYSLLPMDKNHLVQGYKSHPSPFFMRNKTEKSFIGFFERIFSSNASEEERQLNPTTVTRALYDSLQSALRDAIYVNGFSSIGSIAAPSQHIFDQALLSYRHPFFKCLGNPFEFFHIEKKIIVGDIGSDYSDLKYEYGLTKSYNVQRSFDYAYSAQWSMSRSFSAKLGAGVGFFGGMERFINPLNVVNPVLAFSGVRLDSDWSTSRSDADSNRRQHSLRFSDESMYLQLNHSVISIRLKNFRHCLVLRAKNLAFDKYKDHEVWRKDLAENFVYQIPYIKSGLMICSKDIKDDEIKNPFYITEDYFYMYQLIPGDRGQFQNPLSFRNRPFVMSIRGITEMEKLGFLLHAFVETDKKEGVEDYNPYTPMTNTYNSVPRPADGIRKMIQQVKVWDKTGFYPGVYNVKYDEEHYLLRDPKHRGKGMMEKFGEWLHKNTPFGYIRFDNTEALPERGGKP